MYSWQVPNRPVNPRMLLGHWAATGKGAAVHCTMMTEAGEAGETRCDTRT